MAGSRRVTKDVNVRDDRARPKGKTQFVYVSARSLSVSTCLLDLLCKSGSELVSLMLDTPHPPPSKPSWRPENIGCKSLTLLREETCFVSCFTREGRMPLKRGQKLNWILHPSSNISSATQLLRTGGRRQWVLILKKSLDELPNPKQVRHPSQESEGLAERTAYIACLMS